MKKNVKGGVPMPRHLYIMLSRTDTGMGRLIRFFTKETYNHVSLCLDDRLDHFVSFARFRQDVPLAGGYVAEPPERLLSCGKTMPVRIFKLDISPKDAEELEAIFALAGHSPLTYNTLGALLHGCHIPCRIPGSYTCLEFAGAILGRTFPSIQALADTLEPLECYRGDLFDLLENSGKQDDPYFQKRGVWKGALDTGIHFKTLLFRLLRLERPSDPIVGCTFHIITKNIPQSSH